MKKRLFLSCVGLALLTVLIGQFAGTELLGARGGTEKVSICHNGRVIEVAPAAVPAHLAHGDELADPYYIGRSCE